MAVYRTQDNDMLDDVCYRHYGRSTGVVELVLQANPHLADLGSVLPIGVLITLPVIQPQAKAAPVRLWD
jgi:phage tail protein X